VESRPRHANYIGGNTDSGDASKKRLEWMK
jgi:hypothetical protein